MNHRQENATVDWRAFVASIVASLAWPGALVVVVLVLRRSLNRLLPDLNRLRYKDLELQFGKEVAKAKAEIEATSGTRQLPAPALPLGDDRRYFEALAEVSPRAAVLEAWIPFEAALSHVATNAGLSSAERPLQMPRLVEELKKRGLLTEHEAQVVSRLRTIRNEIVHAPAVLLPAVDVADFATVLREIAAGIQNRLTAQQLDAADERR